MRELLGRLILLVALATGFLAGTGTVAAHAATVPAPLVTGISNGGRYQQGSVTAITVDFSALPANQYTVSLYCGSNTSFATLAASVPDNPVVSYDFGSRGLNRPGVSGDFLV